MTFVDITLRAKAGSVVTVRGAGGCGTGGYRWRVVCSGGGRGDSHLRQLQSGERCRTRAPPIVRPVSVKADAC